MARPFTSIVFPWKCPACLRPIQSARALSTTPRRLTELRPESPQYIDIPEPHQNGSGHRRRIKGVLPPPRDIFAKSRGNMAHAKDENRRFAVIPPSKVPGRAAEADAERATWKARMARLRRKNLHRGLTGLAKRRLGMNADRHRQQKTTKNIDRGLANKPLPEDEVLTRTTVPLSMLQYQRGAALPDPDRKARLTRMRRNVEAKEQKKADARRDALHTLYMHARSFITSESQLDDAVERAFRTVEDPKVWGNRGSSIWEERKPDTIEQMMNAANDVQGGAKPRKTSTNPKQVDGTDIIMKRRLGRVAEELTGGKI